MKERTFRISFLAIVIFYLLFGYGIVLYAAGFFG